MRFPRFWAVVEGSGPDQQGERFFRRVWGWSMSSVADARVVAEERLRDALSRLWSGERPGHYYPRAPLREPILDELLLDGEQAFVITRNRYGAEVLNTDRLLIADIDLPDLDRPAGRGWRRRPARTTAEPDPGEPAVVVERLGVLADWARGRYDLGVVVYRTASGLRVFVTGLAEPASSAQGQQILAELDADPIYRELCRAHTTFRARLTPKPWRLPGMSSPLGRWPFEDDRAARRFEDWLIRYERASAGFAVCRWLASYGPGPSTMEEQILRRHDDRTGVRTTLPLA